MKNTLIIPNVHLRALNAFDVGNNPEHLDLGLGASELNSLVETHMTTLAQTQMLTIAGHALELLDEDSPEHIEKIKSFVQENNISLIGMPFYNTALSLLSPENFIQQWDANQQALQTHFGNDAKSLYVGAQAIPTHLSSTIADLGVTVIGNNSLDVDSVELGTQSVKDVSNSVGTHSAYHQNEELTSLAKNVTDELIVFEPFLAKDKQLNQTWQHLASAQVLSKLNGSNPQLTYDTYFSMMNILNDLAHTVRNVELVKKGQFETKAEIVEQPSTRILEVLSTKRSGTSEKEVVSHA